MFGIGTLINTGAVVAGGLLGITLKKGIPERFKETLMQACGIATIFIGIGGVLAKMLTVSPTETGAMIFGTQGTMLLIFSLVIGGLIGAALSIEQRLENAGEWLKQKFHAKDDNLFVEGFVTATLVICIGAMAIVGSIEDGLTGNYATLTAKAVLDFVIVAVFASTLGKGTIFSAIPIFLYQGAITCIAAIFGNIVSPELIDSMSYVGSALIFCVGVNVAFGKKFAVGNLLPAVFIPVFYHVFLNLIH